MEIRPLYNHVIFEFTDYVNNRSVVSRLDSGILLSNDAEITDQGIPRWGKVISIGPDVIDDSIIVGQYILINPLKWTTLLKYAGNKYWKTDESNILCTSEVKYTRY